jgi:hypothetical protein
MNEKIMVTRLDEFSLIGRLLFGGSFLKITEVAHLGLPFFHGRSNAHIHLDKKLVGLHLGQFCHKLI